MKSFDAFLIPCQVVDDEIKITPGTFTLVMKNGQPVQLVDEDQNSHRLWIAQVSNVSAPTLEDVGAIKQIILQFFDSANSPAFLVIIDPMGQEGVIHPDDIKDLWLTLEGGKEKGSQEFGSSSIAPPDGYPEVSVTVWVCPSHPDVPPYVTYQLGAFIPPCPICHESRKPALKLLHLRLDVAVPDKVYVGQVFDLAIAIRQWTSPVLNEDDLSIVKSGKVQVRWPESQPFVRLRLQVSAPACKIVGKNNCSFPLWFNQDSPIFSFQLVPKGEGEVSIVVTAFQEDDTLGTARIHTVATRVAGSIRIETISQPLRSTIPKEEGNRSMTIRSSEKTKRYYLQNIRDLLIAGFTDEELRRFCYDVPNFRPVYDQLAQSTGKAKIIDELIEYADQKLQLEALLTLAKKYNPARYEKHQPYYEVEN